MPDLKLGLNDKAYYDTQGRTSKSKAIEFNDIKFHQCVRLGKFENETHDHVHSPRWRVRADELPAGGQVLNLCSRSTLITENPLQHESTVRQVILD
jgi:hypothetical protein